MRPTPTYLRSLNNCLSGRSKKIFPNQVVFYNAVFGMTNPALFADAEVGEVQRIGQGQRTTDDEERIKKVNYLLRSGLDSNSANVGKHINNAQELPIPKQHKSHYLDDTGRGEIVRRLEAVIWFCVAFHPGKYRLEASDFAELLEQMKEELAEASDTLARADELTVEILANVVYEVLLTHLTRLQEEYYPMPENDDRPRVDLRQQLEEYARKVDCYGTYNADRFFALQRLAETNVVAANALGDIYYYGAQYQEVDEGGGSHGVLRIEMDRDAAAHYYKKAAGCNPPITSACWSLGYLIWNHMFGDVGTEAEELAMSYFRQALEQEYLPAFNSVGLIYFAKADALYKKTDRSGSDEEEMLSWYGKAMEACDKAGCGGWVYGHINVAEHLEDPAFMREIWPRIRERVTLAGPINVRERWKRAADQNNLWAIHKLALLDCHSGDLSQAIAGWERAAALHYPAAGLYLAQMVYAPGRPLEDEERYQRWLEQASADGSAAASLALARQRRSRLYLARALEQNFKRFDNDLYHQIKDLEKQWQKETL